MDIDYRKNRLFITKNNMKQQLTEEFIRMQKLAGIQLNEGMGETVSYDGEEMEVVAEYPNMIAAIKGIMKYLGEDDEMFRMWMEGDGLPALQEYGLTTPVVHLAGPGEAPGDQPPIIVSMDELD